MTTEQSTDRQSDDRLGGRESTRGGQGQVWAIMNKCKDSESTVNLSISIGGKKLYK